MFLIELNGNARTVDEGGATFARIEFSRIPQCLWLLATGSPEFFDKGRSGCANSEAKLERMLGVSQCDSLYVLLWLVVALVENRPGGDDL